MCISVNLAFWNNIISFNNFNIGSQFSRRVPNLGDDQDDGKMTDSVFQI